MSRPGSERPTIKTTGTYDLVATQLLTGPTRPTDGVQISMTGDDLVIDLFRSSGRMLNAGAPVRVPALPRTTWAMTILRIEAKRDQHVRRALEASLAKDELRRQLEPRTIRRNNCGVVVEVR